MWDRTSSSGSICDIVSFAGSSLMIQPISLVIIAKSFEILLPL